MIFARTSLDKKQKKTVSNWMGAARFTYNKCLEEVKERKFPLNRDLLRDKFVTEKALQMTPDRKNLHKDNGIVVGAFLKKYTWLKETPKNIRYNAVRSLVKAVIILSRHQYC